MTRFKSLGDEDGLLQISKTLATVVERLAILAMFSWTFIKRSSGVIYAPTFNDR